MIIDNLTDVGNYSQSILKIKTALNRFAKSLTCRLIMVHALACRHQHTCSQSDLIHGLLVSHRTRLERWERANDLGLDPPKEVDPDPFSVTYACSKECRIYRSEIYSLPSKVKQNHDIVEICFM